MRTFTATELSRMRAAQEAAMQDTCQILAYSSTPDAYNNPNGSWPSSGSSVCGFEPVKPQEVQGSGEVPVIDAKLRLPMAITLDERNRIRMTHRFGEALSTAEEYEIVGPVKRGPSGLVVELRLRDDV